MPSDGRTYHHLRSNLALKLNLDLIEALDFTVNYTESIEGATGTIQTRKP